MAAHNPFEPLSQTKSTGDTVTNGTDPSNHSKQYPMTEPPRSRPARRRSSSDSRSPLNLRRSGNDAKATLLRRELARGEKSGQVRKGSGQYDGESYQTPLRDVSLNIDRSGRQREGIQATQKVSDKVKDGAGQLWNSEPSDSHDPFQSQIVHKQHSGSEKQPLQERVVSMPVANGYKTPENASDAREALHFRGQSVEATKRFSPLESRDKASATGGKSRDARPLEDNANPHISWREQLEFELSSAPSKASNSNADLLYEPSSVKLERLLNFMLLPSYLEGVLWFGTLACFDAWLYLFTILPIRFLRVVGGRCLCWRERIWIEVRFLFAFMYAGLGRVLKRQLSYILPTNASKTTPRKGPRRRRSESDTQTQSVGRKSKIGMSKMNPPQTLEQFKAERHSRKLQEISRDLSPVERADVMKGLVISLSSLILMSFDASMMYHSIRGQATIKLYVIYNVLEVSLLDVFGCLF